MIFEITMYKVIIIIIIINKMSADNIDQEFKDFLAKNKIDTTSL